MSPSGESTQLPWEWATDRDGEYAAMMVPGVNGVHTVNVTAVVGRDTIRSTAGYVRVADPTAEFFGAEMRPAVLRQFADETGGKFYRTSEVSRLPEDIVRAASRWASTKSATWMKALSSIRYSMPSMNTTPFSLPWTKFNRSLV